MEAIRLSLASEEDRRKREEALSVEEKQKLDEARAVECFTELAQSHGLIGETLNQFASFVNGQGWHAVILKVDGARLHPSAPAEPSIGMYFTDEGRVNEYEPNNNAFIRFSCNSRLGSITISTNSKMPKRGGVYSNGKSVALEDITAKIVSEHTTKLLTRVLSGKF